NPIFGGQLNVGLFGLVGPNSTQLNGDLTLPAGPLSVTRQGTISQTTTGFGDLYPLAAIRWNNGVHNGWCTAPATSRSATTIRPISQPLALATEPPMAAAVTPILIPSLATNSRR